MGAPLKLTSEDMRNVARALDDLASITAETGVKFAVYDRFTIEINGAWLKVNEADGKYIIDDQSGD